MNINYTAPCNFLGYGVTSLNLALALQNEGHAVSWWPIGQSEAEHRHEVAIKAMFQNRDYFDAAAPSLRIWHQFDMAQHVGVGTHCGFPIFELDNFNRLELHHLASLDRIIVCSEWAKTIVKKLLPIADVRVVPLGVDDSLFNGGKQGGSYANDTSFTTFLNIGKWEFRKGHDVLAAAFHKAFEPRDRVRLWMMNDNPFLNQQQTNDWEELYKKGRMGNKVSFIPRVSSHGEVAQIMKKVDCGVFPARAEGWNLELLEMMAIGKHVIATDYAGHTEFCGESNCRLIMVDSLEDAEDGIWFHKQGKWANMGESQIDQLIEHMRAVHRDVQDGKMENIGGIKTGTKFTWKNSARKLAEELV